MHSVGLLQIRAICEFDAAAAAPHALCMPCTGADMRVTKPIHVLRASQWTLGQMTGVVIPLFILWGVLALLAPRFLSSVNISNLSVQFAIIGTLAIGTTAIIICREIDLSIGAVEGFCAVIGAIVAVKLAAPWPLAALAAILAGSLVGALNGWLVTRIGIPSFVATLGVLGIVSGGGLVISGGETIYGFPDAYQWIGQGSLLRIRAPLLFCVALLLVMHFTLRHTTTGLGFYAAGGNERAANLVGIPVHRIKCIAFIISGSCAGLAGVINSARLDSANPTLGTLDLLDAIAAVVIGGASLSGGAGTILGTSCGVLLIVTIRNGLTLLGVNPFIQQTVVGTIIIAAAILGQVNSKRQV
jgi:ribose/xylose/arabinose/galactoside ABC-type transport system permease subunit